MYLTRFEIGPMLAKILLLSLAIAALCSISASAQDSQTSKKILILFTHQSDQPGQITVEQAIRSNLTAGSSVPPEIYSEYLDAVRVPLEGYEKELMGELQR